MTPKLARRIPTEERSDTSAESSISGDEATYSANYNEHERPGDASRANPRSVAAVATTAPIVKPTDDAVRRRAVEATSSAQRSEDIHPTPPTLRSSQVKPTLARSAATNAESISLSGSDDTDREEKPSSPVKREPAATTVARFSPPATAGPTAASQPTMPQRIGRPSAGTQDSAPPAARGAAASNARGATGSTPNPNSKRSVVFHSSSHRPVSDDCSSLRAC